ncbi:MAG: 5'-3' exonuclease H3TH domain-containing protein, partial [bacterium]|nr:5'-3' exonuclease H3TH domain-containing protein [bacterium]
MVKPLVPTLLIVDGNAILHRAYHALPPMTAPDGRVVHAAYGFLTMFFKALADLDPTHVAATFDLPGGTFRNALLPSYQAQREEKPDDLYAQIPMIKDILGGMGVPVYEVEGFEADDAIGTIVERIKNNESRIKGALKIRAIVLTGDKDLLQLVGDGVEVVLLRRGMTDTGRYDRDAVIERFGFPPERLPDFKALAGDPSDNYPGVPGIGEKTATELVKAFGGVEEILKAAGCGREDEFTNGRESTKKRKGNIRGIGDHSWIGAPLTPKLVAKLCEHADIARLGLRLATIVRDVPVEFDFAACERGAYDREEVVEKLRKLGFTSLVNRLPTPSNSPSSPSGTRDLALLEEGGRAGVGSSEDSTVEVPSSPLEVRKAIAEARVAGAVALAVVADDDDPRRGHPRALGVAYTDANSRMGANPRIRAMGMVPWGTALSESVGLLRDAAVAKDAHDAKSLLHALHRSRIELDGLRHDTEIMSYLLAPGNRSHDLAHVAFAELGIEPQAPHPLTLPLPEARGETKRIFSPSQQEGER